MSLTRTWIKTCLFLVSYFPLFVIVSILYYENSFILYSAIGLSITGFTGFFLKISVLSKLSGEYFDRVQVKSEGKINFQYFLAYIIPFIAVDFDTSQQFIAYSVLFIFIGILYVKTNLIYVNPTLTMLGYNLFEFKTDEGSSILISRNNYDNVLKSSVIKVEPGLYYEHDRVVKT